MLPPSFVGVDRADRRPSPALSSCNLVECTQGHPERDALVNRFLKTCEVIEMVPERLARRAAMLRTGARIGSAVDALVVAFAEPGGSVITSDPDDLEALAAFTDGVRIAAFAYRRRSSRS